MQDRMTEDGVEQPERSPTVRESARTTGGKPVRKLAARTLGGLTIVGTSHGSFLKDPVVHKSKGKFRPGGSDATSVR